jgi:hypothetical protein
VFPIEKYTCTTISHTFDATLCTPLRKLTVINTKGNIIDGKPLSRYHGFLITLGITRGRDNIVIGLYVYLISRYQNLSCVAMCIR